MDAFAPGNSCGYRHVQDARDALMRGRPDVGAALAALDRAEEDGIAAWRARRERSPSFRDGIEINPTDADMIADLDQARRELEAVPPKPHAALPLLDRIVAGMPQTVDTSPGLPLSTAGYLPRKTGAAMAGAPNAVRDPSARTHEERGAEPPAATPPAVPDDPDGPWSIEDTLDGLRAVRDDLGAQDNGYVEGVADEAIKAIEAQRADNEQAYRNGYAAGVAAIKPRADAAEAARDAARRRYDDFADGFWRIVAGSNLRGALPSNELDTLTRIVRRLEDAEAKRAGREPSSQGTSE